MALSVKNLKRVFLLDGKTSLPDPNPELTVKEVMDLYSSQYPQLNNATVEGPVIDEKKEQQKFTFKTVLGEKG